MLETSTVARGLPSLRPHGFSEARRTWKTATKTFQPSVLKHRVSSAFDSNQQKVSKISNMFPASSAFQEQNGFQFPVPFFEFFDFFSSFATPKWGAKSGPLNGTILSQHMYFHKKTSNVDPVLGSIFWFFFFLNRWLHRISRILAVLG